MTLTPLALMGLGVPELVIILVVVLLLFGGTRLAGLGKSTGRALKEFKEETKGLRDGDKPGTEPTPPAALPAAAPTNVAPQQTGYTQPNGTQFNGTQANGSSVTGQAWGQPPANLADPATSELRRDV